VFVLHPPDAAFLTTNIPIVIVHDATWRQYVHAYPGTRNRMPDETYAHGMEAERLAFEKATWIVFFTKWAASAAALEYPWATSKIHVIPPGANVFSETIGDDVCANIHKRLSKPYKILFVGADPQRKGLDVAVEVISKVNKSGIEAVLHVVGVPCTVSTMLSVAPEYACPDERGVVAYGRLRKGIQQERMLLERLYRECYLLLAPSRADCGSQAICDAAAYGLPCLTSGVGGIRDLVQGANGISVGTASPAEVYAQSIEQLFASPLRYESLCRGASTSYKTVHNWEQHLGTMSSITHSSANNP
jgi:glycosyltransferase involved in cell wall biosynthesis